MKWSSGEKTSHFDLSEPQKHSQFCSSVTEWCHFDLINNLCQIIDAPAESSSQPCLTLKLTSTHPDLTWVTQLMIAVAPASFWQDHTVQRSLLIEIVIELVVWCQSSRCTSGLLPVSVCAPSVYWELLSVSFMLISHVLFLVLHSVVCLSVSVSAWHGGKH